MGNDGPPLPPDSEAAARFHAYNEWLKQSDSDLLAEAFAAGWKAAAARLTEDYYTLAEIRLVTDMDIVEYGSCMARLQGIAELIDKKRPELKPDGQRRETTTEATGD